MGDFIADIIVNDIIIIELKSVRGIAKAHEVQLVNYLTATGKDVGLVINFGPEQVEIKRKSKTLLCFPQNGIAMVLNQLPATGTIGRLCGLCDQIAKIDMLKRVLCYLTGY